jgi:hypothetical protein
MITTRIAPGMYKISDGTNEVEVFRNDFWDGPAWIALACWDKHTVTDPVPTKRQAVIHAKQMLERKKS